MRRVITERFNKKVREIFGEKPEVMRFLMNHERKNVLIENLAAEINKLENSLVKTKVDSLNMVIDDFTVMFCRAALDTKETETRSYVESMRLEREAQAQKELHDELERDYEQSNSTGVEHLDPNTNGV